MFWSVWFLASFDSSLGCFLRRSGNPIHFLKLLSGLWPSGWETMPQNIFKYKISLSLLYIALFVCLFWWIYFIRSLAHLFFKWLRKWFTADRITSQFFLYQLLIFKIRFLISTPRTCSIPALQRGPDGIKQTQVSCERSVTQTPSKSHECPNLQSWV